MRNTYALLISVGNYEKMNITYLPTWKMDLLLFYTALTSSLKIPAENIRAFIDNEGYISLSEVAQAMKSMSQGLSEDDKFIFYFSGHGQSGNIVLSDGEISLQSILNFCDNLKAKGKIVIIDSCYSGNYQAMDNAVMMTDETASAFAGKGMAVFASSAANQVSRLGPNDSHSTFTGALSTAMMLKKLVKKGRVSLYDIAEETRYLIDCWNEQNPDKVQNPVIRTNIGGTIYFDVEEYSPYLQNQIYLDTKEYTVTSVEPMSSLQDKRLCAFVILKESRTYEDIARYTYQIANLIKDKEVHSCRDSEIRHGGKEAAGVWCYFGCDEADIVNHTYLCHTIWAKNDEFKKKFFRTSKDTEVIDGIYVWKETSYNLIKKMQQTDMPRSEYIRVNKELLAEIVTMAEQFIAALNEMLNLNRFADDIRKEYNSWIVNVRRKYLKLSDLPVAPNDLHDWAEEILSLGGWILDMSLLIKDDKGSNGFDQRTSWLIKNSIRKYNESLENLAQIEQNIDLN